MKVETVEAIHKDPYAIELDPAGYFIIRLDYAEKQIIVEHYDYDKNLLHRVCGKDARNLYWTLIENHWVSDLSHAAYLGKELAFAEVALRKGWDYEQR